MIKRLSHYAAMAVFAIAFAASGCGGGGGGGGAPLGAAPVNPAAGAGTTGVVAGTIYTNVSGRTAEAASTAKMPVAAAAVACAGLTGTTGEDGKFVIDKVPVGRQTCTLSKQGYLVRQFTVDVVAGKTTEVNPDDMTPEQSGRVLVTSEPAGAVVFIDGYEISATATNVVLDPVIAGSHTVSVRLDGYEQATASIEVVKDAQSEATFKLSRAVTSISVAWDGAAVAVGAEKQLAASCVYSDGLNADCTSALTWESSATSVVTVSEDGKLKAVAPGTASVTATREQSKLTFPGISVTVACPDGQSWDGTACSGDSLAAIIIAPAAATVQKGNSLALEAKCTWTKAGEAPCPALEWQSVLPSAVSVSNTGVATAVSTGLSTITASAAGITSNMSAVSVPEAANPEPVCDGVSGLCVDIVGAQAAPGGTVALEVRLRNVPAGGIRGGSIAITWDAAALTFASRAAGQGITLQADNSGEPGRFQVAFTSADTLTADAVLFTITLTPGQGAAAANSVKFDQAFEKTNFTDGDFNLVSQNGVTFKDAFVTLPGQV